MNNPMRTLVLALLLSGGIPAALSAQPRMFPPVNVKNASHSLPPGVFVPHPMHGHRGESRTTFHFDYPAPAVAASDTPAILTKTDLDSACINARWFDIADTAVPTLDLGSPSSSPQVFDFSGLDLSTPTYRDTIDFVPSAGHLLVEDFPGAVFCYQKDFYAFANPYTFTLTDVIYYETDAAGFYVLGTVSRQQISPPPSGYPADTVIVQKEIPKALIYPLPLTYGTFASASDTLNTGTSTTVTSRQITADAFGTLVIPGGSAFPAIRVLDDEIQIQTLNGGSTIRTRRRSVGFLSKPFGQLAFEVDTLYSGGVTHPTQVSSFFRFAPLDSIPNLPGSISGTIFNDLNSNGVRDPGDSALSGWTVHLSGYPPTLTDTGGHYTFSGVNPGVYTLGEDIEDGWLQTFPFQSGQHTVVLGSGQNLTAKDFGNIRGYKYVGPDNGNWSDTSNWAGHTTPAPLNPVLIPCQTTVIADTLPSDSILALRICHGGKLSFHTTFQRLKIRQAADIDSTASIEFVSDSGGMVCYSDFRNKGDFSSGQSTVVFAGDRSKSIVSLSGATRFFNLELSGDSTGTIGNLSVKNALRLHRTLYTRAEDTVLVDTTNPAAITDTGRIPLGTVTRTIGPGATDPYRFESTQSYLQFCGTGTNPTTVAVTTLPDTVPASFTLDWQLMGGVIDTVQNTIRRDSVKEFTRWALGVPRPNLVSGVPTVNREYAITASGGSGFCATLQLRYNQSEVPVSTPETPLQLLHGPYISDTAEGRWNMISLPLVPDELQKDLLFPGAISPAFAYQGAYVVEPSLEFGSGYWLRFPTRQAVTILGDEREEGAIPVTEGWNLIGTISFPVPVSSVTSSPSGIIKSRFFGYGTGYEAADTLRPLRAYWVKVSQAGQLILKRISAGTGKAATVVALKEFSVLSLSDAEGGGQSLYFGSTRVDQAQVEMPPPAPAGTFDARFGDGRWLEVSDRQTTREIPILISSAAYPVTIGWKANDPSVHATLMVDGKPKILLGQGEISIAGPASGVSLILPPLSGGELPKEFALAQNYPNPFNPSTVIRYELPGNSGSEARYIVSLKIYNVLGQVVTTLADEVEASGIRTVEWNAAGFAAGVYFYRLDARDTGDPNRAFTKVNKALLIR